MTQRSSRTRLLWLGPMLIFGRLIGAIIFGFFDNEPRNREIVARISKVIDRGDKIVIWPKNIQQKDINDMHLAGHDVQTLVQSNVYQGLQATLKFNDWKKV